MGRIAERGGKRGDWLVGGLDGGLSFSRGSSRGIGGLKGNWRAIEGSLWNADGGRFVWPRFDFGCLPKGDIAVATGDSIYNYCTTILYTGMCTFGRTILKQFIIYM